MNGCRIGRRKMTLYLDRELDPDQALDFEAHLDRCDRCADLLERSRKIEDLLEATLSPLSDPDVSETFLETVRQRLDAAGARKTDQAASAAAALPDGPDRRTRLPIRIFWAAAGTAAAAVLLLWLFHQQTDRHDGEISSPADRKTARDATDRRSTARERSERLLARQELSAVLAQLADLPDSDLCRSFEEGASSLESRGWRIDFLLCGALTREGDASLQSAIRLAGLWPGFSSVPRAIDSLERLLKEKRFPLETMTALAALDGPRAEAALGKALLDPELRDHALACLETMAGDGPVARISKALLPRRETTTRVPLTVFDATALAALSRMGPRGVEGIVEFCGRRPPDPDLIRAVSASGPGFKRDLAAALPGFRGQRLDAALRIAASLRLEEALPLMRRAAERSSLEVGDLALISRTGGPLAVTTLVEIYQGPVSLRERRRIAAALVRSLRLHPDELDQTLHRVFFLLPPDQSELIPELLSMEGSGEACRVLAWLVSNQPDVSFQAAFELARTGSSEALASLLALLEGDRLTQEARAAASAAAIHLGGREAVKSILGEGTRISERDVAGPGRPGRITDSRFRKILEIIERHPSSRETESGG